jgi:thioredoxin reductase (NADPH)
MIFPAGQKIYKAQQTSLCTMTKQYELAIIGTGPAGMNAAIYAARYKIKALALGEVMGGMAAEAHEICNLFGFSKIKGYELSMKVKEQAESLGVETKQGKVMKITKKESEFEIKTEDNKYSAKKIILAMGTEKRKLGLKRENEMIGKGVSYCATCDAAFYKNKTAGVAGGGNSALTAALLIAEFASKVYIIYRREKFFRAEPAWVEAVEKNKKIESVFKANVTELIGEKKLEEVKLDNGKKIKLDGLFIELGSEPNTELCQQLGVELENGHIKVDKTQRTNVPGVFAAGDITNNALKQIITAAAEGAIAATQAYSELRK